MTASATVLQRVGLYSRAASAWRTVNRLLPDTRRRRRAALHLYGKFAGPGDVCFDVGANLGDRTEVLVALGARVVAVEPQPGCIDHLRRRFESTAQVHVVPAALGAESGQADLAFTQAHAIASMSPGWMNAVQRSGRFAGYRWDRKVTVPVTTLDELIAIHGLPAFVKIDVEGYEPEVLAGLSQPLPALCVEFAPEWLQATFTCMDRLAILGTYRYNYDLNESMNLELPRWVEDAELRSLLGAAAQPGVFGNVYARLQN